MKEMDDYARECLNTIRQMGYSEDDNQIILKVWLAVANNGSGLTFHDYLLGIRRMTVVKPLFDNIGEPHDSL